MSQCFLSKFPQLMADLSIFYLAHLSMMQILPNSWLRLTLLGLLACNLGDIIVIVVIRDF